MSETETKVDMGLTLDEATTAGLLEDRRAPRPVHDAHTRLDRMQSDGTWDVTAVWWHGSGGYVRATAYYQAHPELMTPELSASLNLLGERVTSLYEKAQESWQQTPQAGATGTEHNLNFAASGTPQVP